MKRKTKAHYWAMASREKDKHIYLKLK